MSKIYDLPFTYKLCKLYVSWAFKRFYSHYIILGSENIPQKGPVLFAPNHLNALMDALAVTSVTPDHYATVFLARSDMFKQKMIASMLYFFKIMPAFRIRDGYATLGKNAEIFEKCIEVLEHDNAMCIMPEGNQELERKLRPLVKGIFRVAFSAQERLGTSRDVKIIPVGIDMGNLEKSNTPIIINFGEPISITGYMAEYGENPVTATNNIKNELKVRLESLTLNLNSEQYYNEFESITWLTNIAVLKELQLADNAVNRFHARQEIAGRLVALEKGNALLTEEICMVIRQFDAIKKKYNLHYRNFDIDGQTNKNLIIKLIALLFISPIFIAGLALNLLPFFAPVAIRKAMRVEFRGFYSSLHFGISLISFPLFYLLQTALFISISGVSWWSAILFIPLQFILGKWALNIYKRARKLIGQLHFNTFRKNKKAAYVEATELRSKILKIISIAK
ncbi:MAG: phospholipid/glycerol acyltransferase [Bacteroidetes bacterium]|nr:phospholipid/glycerol acyltransferase [Bacteroidota bacterium]